MNQVICGSRMMDSSGENRLPVKRLKMQVRFSKASRFQPGLVTEISTGGLTLLCRENPTDRTITLSLAFQDLSTDVVCEALRKETVEIHGHTLNRLELKIVAAPLSYLDIVDAIESKQSPKNVAVSETGQPADEKSDEILEILPEDLVDE